MFTTRSETHAKRPLPPHIWHFHEKRFHLAKRAPLTYVRVGFCQKYVNELPLLPKAPNGINEGNQHEHVCSINIVIIGPSESVFISIHWNNLAPKTDEGKKLWSCLLFYRRCFEWMGNVSTPVKDCSTGVGRIWTLCCERQRLLGLISKFFCGDGSSCPTMQAVMSLFIIRQPVSVIESWLEV